MKFFSLILLSVISSSALSADNLPLKKEDQIKTQKKKLFIKQIEMIKSSQIHIKQLKVQA